MTELAQEKRTRAAFKSRQQEVESELAEFNFAGGPHRLFSGPDVTGYKDAQIRRLCVALKRLGPVFSCFGRYLSSRVDLLPVKHCLELGAIPDRAEATSIAVVRNLIGREIGCSLAQAYRSFEEEPYESRLIFQSHRAWLRSGIAVTVKVIRPEIEEYLLYDGELLSLLGGAFAVGVWSDFPIESAIADFRRALKEQTDFVYEADAIDGLASCSKGLDMLKAPKVYRHFCSSKVLTIERLSGLTLADVISSVNELESRQGRRTIAGDPSNLARNLCHLWLSQVFMGGLFPVDPRPEDILITDDKHIAFTGCGYASLSSAVKANLWNYLLAASAGDPDKACSYLLREMEEAKWGINEEVLKHRFRQIAPFRDGGWSNDADCDSLAEHLFVQWRLAGESGCRPSLHLVRFYRGLFLIATAAYELVPGHDPLRHGLEEVRLLEVLGQFQQMLDIRQMGNNLDRYAAMLMELPRRLDEVLTLAGEGGGRLKLHVTETEERRKQKNSLSVVIALLLVIVAVVLLSHHLASTAGTGPWSERAATILFMLLGAMLLAFASRAR